ncbi:MULTISPECIES: hemerythrin domain-containing protein [Ramlibacter]|uniref:Hemerythrin domain-containing protein n=1 Tax=Ramlibacter aquaticus TaxID=2780094 RepID=A0ABR9SAK8_9BURK|nr:MULTISPECIES: hemerythrin domain-containing protein [Ramlibacter]MBE7939383.1 hemerythrin domain-containing protein [Ramlibacter aquaticus]
MDPTATSPGTDGAMPLQDFSAAHAGLLAGMRRFLDLPALAQAAQSARTLAEQTLRLLDEAVSGHHADEEGELFPAVVRSARHGVEQERVRGIVAQLVEEHRDIEDLWRRLRPQVQHLAQGRPAHLRREAVDLLASVYDAHARFEEREFLPLAREILSRNPDHMEALGLALHLRHLPLPNFYL